MDVDDLLTGGATVEEVHTKKQITSEILNDGKFTLHKWHSNAKELESNKDPRESADELSHAKQQLGMTSSETKMLGMPWDKQNDTIKVVFSRDPAKCTKKRSPVKISSNLQSFRVGFAHHSLQKADLPRHL